MKKRVRGVGPPLWLCVLLLLLLFLLQLQLLLLLSQLLDVSRAWQEASGTLRGGMNPFCRSK